MSTQADVSQDDTPSTAGSNSDGNGEPLLSRFESEKWGSVNDLTEQSTVNDKEALECTKFVERVMRFEEEEMVHELPVTQTGRANIEGQYADEPAKYRDDFVPAEFEEGHADFLRPDTERVNPCSDCGGNGRLRCGNCSGSGRNSCGRCNGTGRNGDSICNKCGGNGTAICGTCDGNGSLACGTCEQKGETWKIDFVRRNFTPEETVSADVSKVPESFVTDADGQFVRTEEHQLADNEIRHEVDVYDVDVTRLDYTYDGERYELYEVDGEDLKAEDYPKNQARKILPYAVAGVVVLLVGVFALMQMGIL